MNHIPKQKWMGCAVATAAMLADRSYEEVSAHWPELDEARMRCVDADTISCLRYVLERANEMQELHLRSRLWRAGF